MTFEFTWKLETRGRGPYQRLLKSLDGLAATEREKLASAASKATQVSRQTFSSRRSGRPFAPNRKGRTSTQGRLESHIVWNDFPGRSGVHSMVELDEEELESTAPYYLINEIGSGEQATRFRHRVDGTLVAEPVAFRSQVGRYIAPGLVWADGGNAVKSMSSRFRTDQIQRAATVSIKAITSTNRRRRTKRPSAVNPLRTPRVRISREIEPKHYIREGGKAGYGQYSTDIRSAARDTFRRR